MLLLLPRWLKAPECFCAAVVAVATAAADADAALAMAAGSHWDNFLLLSPLLLPLPLLLLLLPLLLPLLLILSDLSLLVQKTIEQKSKKHMAIVFSTIAQKL